MQVKRMFCSFMVDLGRGGENGWQVSPTLLEASAFYANIDEVKCP
jgi:hypothetical protein